MNEYIKDDPSLADEASGDNRTQTEGLTQEVSLNVQGMTCASCVNRVEKVLNRVEGVDSASVNLATERATINYNPAITSLEDLKEVVRKAGYEVTEPVGMAGTAGLGGDPHENERKVMRRRLLLATFFTVPIFLLEMVPMMIPGLGMWVESIIPMQARYYIIFVLASLVQFWPGARFYRSGWAALRHWSPDMNSLVMIGTTAAYGYSVVATFLPNILPAGTVHVYYEASAAIITLILLGKYLEAVAKGRTGAAIKKLLGLQSKTARVVREGIEIEIPIEQVLTGDLVQVRPGERIPVDGDVFEGRSYVDESMITGEPIAVSKTSGSEVIGGTINTTGSFTFRTTRIGADTVLSQIIRMVEDAQASKPPIQAVADKVIGVFVPVVLLLASITFVVWLACGPEPALTFALVNAVAVLIIACPCAMGLATPTSIMVGTGKAAELGILFRKGDALQTLQEVNTVALDKTGTLTLGKPTLTDFVVNGFEQQQVMGLIASVESRSEHPVAQAIVDHAHNNKVVLSPVTEFQSVPGFGVDGWVSGHRVQVGADRFMERIGIDTASFGAESLRLAEMGKTPLYAAVDGELAALLAVADPIKESTPQAIKALHKLGLRVAMITGDNRRTAEAIAHTLGIDHVLAEVLPDGKANAVKELQAQGGKVAFVGDGINDAPALAQADVGLAVGTGTDIAIESADAILMSGDLHGIISAIELSQSTMRNIRQNMFWAFFYNVILIPVAAGALFPAFGILLSPVFAAASMGVSSIFVLGNALRLRSFKPTYKAISKMPSASHAPVGSRTTIQH